MNDKRPMNCRLVGGVTSFLFYIHLISDAETTTSLPWILPMPPNLDCIIFRFWRFPPIISIDVGFLALIIGNWWLMIDFVKVSDGWFMIVWIEVGGFRFSDFLIFWFSNFMIFCILIFCCCGFLIFWFSDLIFWFSDFLTFCFVFCFCFFLVVVSGYIG